MTEDGAMAGIADALFERVISSSQHAMRGPGGADQRCQFALVRAPGGWRRVEGGLQARPVAQLSAAAKLSGRGRCCGAKGVNLCDQFAQTALLRVIGAAAEIHEGATLHPGQEPGLKGADGFEEAATGAKAGR